MVLACVEQRAVYAVMWWQLLMILLGPSTDTQYGIKMYGWQQGESVSAAMTLHCANSILQQLIFDSCGVLRLARGPVAALGGAAGLRGSACT